jgi:hypothetical protein
MAIVKQEGGTNIIPRSLEAHALELLKDPYDTKTIMEQTVNKAIP